MNTLQFRALLVDPGNTTQERPVQIFATNRAEIDSWAALVLDKAVSKTAAVLVYQTVEQQCGMIIKPKEEPVK